MLRWRNELAIAAAVLVAWSYAGGVVVGVLVVTLAVLVAFVPSVRTAVRAATTATVVAHRVRSGLVQAGVGDRHGRLPWIVGSWPWGETVWVSVWLRSGTTTGDLLDAAPLIAAACGAAHVQIAQRSPRQDRAVVIVYRPRWGCPGR
ncbi:hypothetical protein [Pseudonocardia nigra]|uniref:hypothetical protein n=1 Tax=Pseudonocardia nigra TaxID=1921578 RepID=UPI001C5DB084|nr:hypothetical protein [Pseudonocardia nigra]